MPNAKSGPKPADFDITRFFSEFKMPAGFDMQAVTEAGRRNMEAIAAANRVAMEGAQSFARRNMEIMQQAMSEMTEALRGLATAEAPHEKAARQAELVKAAYQRAVANIQELSEMIQRSNAEALAVLNKRFTEALDELKAMANKAG
ncbi:MAG TPA: TIGR01841 family phasin [Acetobacteraceae bacterium]|nr:TIGR01841 family phasin [Acetobacteraceae bacterium]